MFERYTLAATAEDLAQRFSAELAPSYQAKYNIAPTQLLPVITNTSPGGFSFFYWGLMPDWSKNKAISAKLINAPADQLITKSSYRRALKQRRCIVPADGFYLWKKVSRKSQIPYGVFLEDNQLFGMAGIWEEFEDENNNNVHTFTIITTAANEVVAEIAEQMPAILEPEVEQRWLSNELSEEELLSMVKTYAADGMGTHTVSPRINQQGYDGADLIRPAPAADQFGNYSLFDD